MEPSVNGCRRARSVGRWAVWGALAWLAAGASEEEALGADVAPPSISHERVFEAPEGRELTISATIVDESPIFAPSVYFRRAGTSEYRLVAMNEVALGRFEAVIPAHQVNGTLEYFIEAFDELGNGPSRAGSPDGPFSMMSYNPVTRPLPEATRPKTWAGGGVSDPSPIDEVSPSTDGGLTSKWWFWTLVAVAAVGGGVAGAYLLTRESPRDLVVVEITGPDPASGL